MQRQWKNEHLSVTTIGHTCQRLVDIRDHSFKRRHCFQGAPATTGCFASVSSWKLKMTFWPIVGPKVSYSLAIPWISWNTTITCPHASSQLQYQKMFFPDNIAQSHCAEVPRVRPSAGCWTSRVDCIGSDFKHGFLSLSILFGVVGKLTIIDYVLGVRTRAFYVEKKLFAILSGFHHPCRWPS